MQDFTQTNQTVTLGNPKFVCSVSVSLIKTSLQEWAEDYLHKIKVNAGLIA